MDLLFKTIEFAKKLRAWLGGKKSYLVAASMIIAALLAWINGEISNITLVQRLLEGCTIAAVRAAITKSGPLGPGR